MPLDGYISAYDMASGQEVGATLSVERLRLVWAANVSGSCEYEVYADGVDLIAASPAGTTMLSLSFNGGVSVHARMILQAPVTTYAQDRPHLTEQGPDTSEGLVATTIDRLAVTQAPIDDILSAPAGEIRVYTGDCLLPFSAGPATVPDQQGIFVYPIGNPAWANPGVLQYFARYEPGPDGQVPLLDIILYRDTVMSALLQICKRLGGVVDPELANFTIDSGDFAPGGGSRCVVVGFKGTTSYLHFDGLTDGAPYPVLPGGTQQQPRNNVLSAGANFYGGQSNHGRPDGGIITDIVLLNKGRPTSSTAWDTNLPVVAIYASKSVGGVYYWPGDGILHPMSQAMGVHALWHDEVDNILFAATDAGLYTALANPLGTVWVRDGDFRLICTRVMKDISSRIYILAKGNPTGWNGVLVSGPGIAGDANLGGWQWAWQHESADDFCAVDDIVYLLDATRPHKILRLDTSTSKSTEIDVPGGNVATKLEPFILAGAPAAVFVLTAAGSAGLYYIDRGASFCTNLNNDKSLVDVFGAPVMVNNISSTNAGTINGNGVSILAWTNKGMYETNGVGGSWHRTDGQSGLTDTNLTHGDAGPAQTVLGRRQNRIFATTGDTLYISYNGALHWIDEFAEPLDGGAAWFALNAAVFGTPPDNALDTIPAYGYPVYRTLDGPGHFTYTSRNAASNAPYGRVTYDEIADITADSFTRIRTASSLVLQANARHLGISAEPLVDLTVESWTDDDQSLLLTLRPGHMVTITADVRLCVVGIGQTTYIHYDSEPFWVIKHEATLDGTSGGLSTLTTLCNRYIPDGPLSPRDQNADLPYKLSRVQLNAKQRR